MIGPVLRAAEPSTPPRWLASRDHRRLVGRGVAAALVGLLIGLSVVSGETEDQQKGAQLTREQYDKDFASYRTKLLHPTEPTGSGEVVLMIFVVVLFFAVFEGAALTAGAGVGVVDDALERRRARRRPGMLDDTDP